jgi:hypothetical protein
MTARAALTAAAMTASAPVLPTAPSQITIIQRTTKPLPGTNGTILARIGDITGGQVLLKLEDSRHNPILDTVSVHEGDVRTFTVGTASFDFELTQLKNFLVGEDFAVFTIRAAGTAMSEQQKIQRLISAVASEPGVTFIRNGKPYSGTDAAAHLSRKLEAANGKGLTAREFIDEIGSASSVSGEPYRVRLADGREQTAQEWLTAKLRDLEQRREPSANPSSR